MRRKPPAWEDAFCEYFAARQRSFLRTAYAIVGSWPTAEDVTQSTFSSLYVYWPKIQPDRWTRTRDASRSTPAWRASALVGRETVTHESPDAGVCVDTTAQLDLRRALQHLSRRDRAVLALRFLDDLPVHDVAAILQVPPGTVKSQTSRALERLRVVMEGARQIRSQMTIEDNIRSELAKYCEEVQGGPSLEAAIAAGRTRRTKRHLAAVAGSAAAVTVATVLAASLVSGGSEAPGPSGGVLQPAAQPPAGTSGADLQGFRNFVDGSNVDEAMQAAIEPNLPAGANAAVTDVYPSDWSRNTPLPDGQAENATDWQAVYSLPGGETLRVVMGLPVPY